MKKRNNVTRVVNIVLLVISMLTIFLFSSENGNSSDKTSETVGVKVVETVEKVTKKEVDEVKITDMVKNNMKIIRKGAHFIEYFILGYLLINIFKDYNRVTYKYILLSIVIACFYACGDEVHQLFVVGRTARAFDVIIDTIGAGVGALCYYGIYTYILRKPNYSKNSVDLA